MLRCTHSFVRSRTHSRACGKKVFVHKMNASISYSFNPLYRLSLSPPPPFPLYICCLSCQYPRMKLFLLPSVICPFVQILVSTFYSDICFLLINCHIPCGRRSSHGVPCPNAHLLSDVTAQALSIKRQVAACFPSYLMFCSLAHCQLLQ